MKRMWVDGVLLAVLLCWSSAAAAGPGAHVAAAAVVPPRSTAQAFLHSPGIPALDACHDKSHASIHSTSPLPCFHT
jgi:hypothetical protein